MRQLDHDRPKWRDDTIVQLDGAKYHKTNLIKELFKELQVPVMISAPYSYDAAVAELFFAAFKRDEINQMHLATSKSKSCLRLFILISSIIFFRVFLKCGETSCRQV